MSFSTSLCYFFPCRPARSSHCAVLQPSNLCTLLSLGESFYVLCQYIKFSQLCRPPVYLKINYFGDDRICPVKSWEDTLSTLYVYFLYHPNKVQNFILFLSIDTPRLKYKRKMVYIIYGNHLCLVRQSHTTDKYTTWPKFSFINLKALDMKLATRILMVENAEKRKWNTAAKGLGSSRSNFKP